MKRVRDRFGPRAACALGLMVVGLQASVLPAMALGGSRSWSSPGLGKHLVMVLGQQGARHNACTGTIIAQNVVLTAAHCVAGPRKVVVAYPENGGHVAQEVKARAIHPEYSPRSAVSIDIALLRLDAPLPARFVPIPFDEGQSLHQVGRRLEIAGIGMQAEGSEDSAGTLRSGSVEVLPRLFPRYLRLGTGPDAELADLAICIGDSGGPVLDRGDGGLRVIGVVYGREKFGEARSCGTIAQAVRLQPQARWIRSTLQRWAGGASPRPRR